MILDEFQKIIARVETATGRRFRPEQTVELYHQLSGFDGNTLNEAFNIYLSQEDPPKNLEWFIKNQCKEILFKNRSTEERQFEDRQKVFEVTFEQHSLFLRCVVIAMDKFHGRDYIEWAEKFNQIWTDYAGESLDRFLNQTYKILAND